MKTYSKTYSMPKTYPLADYYPNNFNKKRIQAIKSGAFRKPKKGDWYLSGAIIEAYKAPYDLSAEYHIAKLVKVREIALVVVEPI